MDEKKEIYTDKLKIKFSRYTPFYEIIIMSGLIFSVFIVLIVAAFYGYLSSPSFDDFCPVGSGNPFAFAVNEYYKWSGRWLSMILLNMFCRMRM